MTDLLSPPTVNLFLNNNVFIRRMLLTSIYYAVLFFKINAGYVSCNVLISVLEQCPRMIDFFFVKQRESKVILSLLNKTVTERLVLKKKVVLGHC